MKNPWKVQAVPPHRSSSQIPSSDAGALEVGPEAQEAPTDPDRRLGIGDFGKVMGAT